MVDNKSCSNEHRILPIKIIGITAQHFSSRRTAHMRKCHKFKVCNIFIFNSFNTIHNLNQFLHASLSTLTWHIGGAKFTNLSLYCAQSCVTTYWYHDWYLLWLIIYGWLSTKQKQVGKILILPKKHTFACLVLSEAWWNWFKLWIVLRNEKEKYYIP